MSPSCLEREKVGVYHAEVGKVVDSDRVLHGSKLWQRGDCC